MGLFASDACISICWDVSRARRSSACSWTAHNAHSVDARATGAAHTPAALCRSPHTARPSDLRTVPWAAERELLGHVRRPDARARIHVPARAPDQYYDGIQATGLGCWHPCATLSCMSHPAHPPCCCTAPESLPQSSHTVGSPWQTDRFSAMASRRQFERPAAHESGIKAAAPRPAGLQPPDG